MRTVSQQQHGRRGWRSAVLWNLGVATAYCLVGSASLLLVNETGASSPVWPAAGIGVAAIFLRGPILTPGVAVGSIAANLLIPLPTEGLDGRTVLLAVLLAIGPVLGAVVGGTVTRRVFGRHPALADGGEILGFLALAAVVPAAVSATIGIAVQLATGIATPGNALVVWLTWFVGDAIGIIVLLPLLIMLAPGQAENWRGRRWKVALPSILLLVGVAVAGMHNASLIVEQRESARSAQGRDAAELLRAELDANRDLLTSIVAWNNSTVDPDAAAFRKFTAPILAAHPEVHALSWNPVVPNAQRAAFTAAQRTEPGMSDYAITERSPSGALRPAGIRESYTPVAFIEPFAENGAALGFDIASNEIRAAAIDRARTSGRAQATAPVTLVQETGEQLGVLLVAPATGADGTVDAYAVGVFRLGDVLAAALDRPRWRDWNFVLAEATAGARPVVLAALGPNQGTTPAEAATVVRQPVEFGGRTWTLTAFPSRATVAAQPPATEPLLLLGSLGLTFLLEAFLLMISGQERRARRHAESSTYEAHHDDVTGLLNRRGFFHNLHAVRDRVAEDGSTSVLMYGDLDHFKEVNDTLGHDAGDDLLGRVAETMQGAVRDRDTVARIGGDEFAVILNNCDLAQAQRIADHVKNEVRACTAQVAGEQWRARMSVGLTPIQGPNPPTVDALLRAADAACYEAKRAGRDTIRTTA